MNVIVATTMTPFSRGGAEWLLDWFQLALENRGHRVETYRIPVHASPDVLPAQMVGLRLWDFTGHGDRLIALRTPSYLVRHHHKVAWFLHHHRPAYDLWDTYPDVPDDSSGREFRRMLFAADEMALEECKQVFTNSVRVRDRLKYFNGIDAEVLYPPLGESVDLVPGPIGGTLVYVSRLVPHKRQLLAVQAMARTRSAVRLIIAGSDEDGSYARAIREEIARSGLVGKVSFVNRAISESEKRELLATALGVVYIPLDEDSYGYVGLEAAATEKPLVTTTDSGGVLELVQHGVSGLVCDPTPAALARQFDTLYENRATAQRMGSALAARVQELRIGWDHTVDRLLA